VFRTVCPATVMVSFTVTVGGVDVAVALVRVHVPLQLDVVAVVPGLMLADMEIVVPPPSDASVMTSVGDVKACVIAASDRVTYPVVGQTMATTLVQKILTVPADCVADGADVPTPASDATLSLTPVI
jgi:hypothetical protein